MARLSECPRARSWLTRAGAGLPGLPTIGTTPASARTSRAPIRPPLGVLQGQNALIQSQQQRGDSFAPRNPEANVWAVRLDKG
jgi:hypothetical protein